MNKSFLVIGGVAVAAVLAFFVLNQQQAPADDMTYETSPTPTYSETQDMVMGNTETRYVDYTPEAFAAVSGRRRVYFFHASWCPTCKAANTMLMENQSAIPEDVVVFKTDYDTNDELKKKYNVTYQHTFVQVDDQGNEVTKWNGGDVNQLIRNIR